MQPSLMESEHMVGFRWQSHMFNMGTITWYSTQDFRETAPTMLSTYFVAESFHSLCSSRNYIRWMLWQETMKTMSTDRDFHCIIHYSGTFIYFRASNPLSTTVRQRQSSQLSFFSAKCGMSEDGSTGRCCLKLQCRQALFPTLHQAASSGSSPN